MAKKSKGGYWATEVRIPNKVWLLPVGSGMRKRPGVEYLCEAAGPLLDGRKMPEHLNRASVRKWSAESNGLRHLRVV